MMQVSVPRRSLVVAVVVAVGLGLALVGCTASSSVELSEAAETPLRPAVESPPTVEPTPVSEPTVESEPTSVPEPTVEPTPVPEPTAAPPDADDESDPEAADLLVPALRNACRDPSNLRMLYEVIELNDLVDGGDSPLVPDLMREAISDPDKFSEACQVLADVVPAAGAGPGGVFDAPRPPSTPLTGRTTTLGIANRSISEIVVMVNGDEYTVAPTETNFSRCNAVPTLKLELGPGPVIIKIDNGAHEWNGTWDLAAEQAYLGCFNVAPFDMGAALEWHQD